MNKAKKTAPKKRKGSKPLRVSFSAFKKPSNNSSKAISLEKEDDNSVDPDESPSTLSKGKPLYSSTPKPVRENVSLPASLPASLTGVPRMTKELRIVLKRIRVEDYIPAKAVAPKNVVKIKKAPVRASKTRRPAKQASKETSSKSEETTSATCIAEPCLPNLNRLDSKQKPAFETEIFPEENHQDEISNETSSEFPLPIEMETSITTQIPSEVLENFGIQSKRQDSPKSRKFTSAIVPETPPHIFSESSSSKTPGYTTPDDGASNSYGSLEMHSSATHFDIASSSAAIPINLGYPTHNTPQEDPLETMIQSEKLIHASLSTNCELSYGLDERLYKQPKFYSLEELVYCNADIRRIAPYSLKLNDDLFFLFAGPVSRVENKFCCLVYGILDNYIVAYGGNFLVEKDRLYDPITKMPVEDVVITNSVESRQHLLLLNIPNKNLLGMEDYCPVAKHPSLVETQLKSLEVYFSSVSQIQLKEKMKEKSRNEFVKDQMQEELRTLRAKVTDSAHSTPQTNRRVTTKLIEPRTEHMFEETNLPITDDSLKRILKSVCAMKNVKKRYGELATFHLSCATEAKFDTAHYVAFEDSGCMPFYRTAFVLGWTENRFVVGVLEGNCFFIMATRRLYNRFHSASKTPPFRSVDFQPDLLSSIHLPLFLPFQHSLTMLEVRQIFSKPQKYKKELLEISETLGLLGSQCVSPPRVSLINNPSRKEPKFQRAWLQQMLDVHFNPTFRNSLCQFPAFPTCPNNGQLFAENVVRLWIHQLMRRLNDFDEEPLATIPSRADHLPLLSFFTLDISVFVNLFLPLFGLSDDHVFQCLSLDYDGLPSTVCAQSLTARCISQHVRECHTLPLTIDSNNPDKDIQFIPFGLVFQSTLPLRNRSSSYEILQWARSTVERYQGQSYLKILQAVEGIKQSLPSNSHLRSRRIKNLVANGSGKATSPFQPPPQKRKRLTEEKLAGEEMSPSHQETSEVANHST